MLSWGFVVPGTELQGKPGSSRASLPQAIPTCTMQCCVLLFMGSGDALGGEICPSSPPLLPSA